MKKTKLSYQKHYGSDGYVYDQRVNISLSDYELFCDEIYLEMKDNFPFQANYTNGNDMNTMYLRPKDKKAKVVYLTLTESRFFAMIFKISLKDRNTYLTVN